MKPIRIDETHAQIAFTPTEIHVHPDRILPTSGDYRGIRIVRDKTIPFNEIHLLDGTHCMILRMK